MEQSSADSPQAARMLVVDDDPRSRKLLESYLRAEAYEVRAVSDGFSAIAQAELFLPDVVLLDVMMPEMNGFEVCAALKDDPRTRLSQVMLVTALDGVSDKIAGLDTGADDYVTKPVRREEFLAKVRALLRVRRLLVDLEGARSELAARNRELELKKTLVQTLVHDLKNPLAAVLGNLDLLEMRAEATLQPTIKRCQQGTSRLLGMVLNLLDVEGLEQGRLRPRSECVDAGDVVRAAVDEASTWADQAGVRLAIDAEPSPTIHADAGLLRRVLDNLLANAVAHSPGGGTVLVSVRGSSEEIEITVSDQGPGIPEGYRERIFEKYTRLDDRLNHGANYGLGLTFCRLAIEAHGGAIWVDDAPRGGAVFRARLPVVQHGFVRAAPAGTLQST